MTTILQCRACGLPIIFVVSSTGKKQPFDATPSKEGQWAIVTKDGARHAVHHGVDASRPDLHVPHHATCPAAELFKRRYA